MSGADQQGAEMAVDILSGDFVPGKDEAPPVPIEELERELPIVYEGQIPLGELLSRVVQAIYAELTEMAETYVHCAL